MKHKPVYLSADAAHPLITHGAFKVEALLYNLQEAALNQVRDNFRLICGKDLYPETNISQLSGGEKVVLMVLMALCCPATHLRFIGIWHALDAEKRLALHALIQASAKHILLEEFPA